MSNLSIKQERLLIKKMYDSVYSDKARAIGKLIRDKVFIRQGNIGQNCILSKREIEKIILAAGAHGAKKALDICSGDGSIALYLSKKLKLDITGVDFSDVGVKAADIRRASKTHFCIGLAENLPLKTRYFDLIYSLDSFIHIYDKEPLIKECFRLLKPNGKFVFSDWIDSNNVPKRIQRTGELWGHIYVISKWRYKQLLKKNGFKLIKITDNGKKFSKTIARWEQVNSYYADHLIKQCGQEYFNKARKRWQLAKELSRSRKLNQLIFICERPAKA